MEMTTRAGAPAMPTHHYNSVGQVDPIAGTPLYPASFSHGTPQGQQQQQLQQFPVGVVQQSIPAHNHNDSGVVTYAPTLSYVTAVPKEDFHQSLCGCCGPNCCVLDVETNRRICCAEGACGKCCLVAACLPCAAAKNIAKISGDNEMMTFAIICCLPKAGLLLSGINRTKLRKSYNLAPSCVVFGGCCDFGETLDDCIVHLCCRSCATCQETEELRFRGATDRIPAVTHMASSLAAREAAVTASQPTNATVQY